MPDVAMPRLSDSMEEGTILKWLKAEGDQVERGDELVEIETDKATMTYEADSAGALHIVAAEGETLPVGAPIATIGEAAAAEKDESGEEDAGEEAQAAEEKPEEPADRSEEAPATASQSAAGNGAPSAKVAATDGGGERVKASPVARRIARDQGIELSEITGSGPGGRIVKADVEAMLERPAAKPKEHEPEPEPRKAAPAPAASETGTAKGDVTVEDLSRIQQLVARRMAESRATIPDFALTTSVDMEGCVDLRKQLKGAAGEDGVVPSFNDMVVKASSLALREHPRANGSYKDGRFELYSRVNIGIAVAAQDSLIVPTIFDADRKSLGQIARDARELAERVRSGSITPPELSGGTFTVSNLGMFGVTRFAAVINPPQAAILAVGAMAPRAVVRDGEIEARHTMDITVSCDHRILYGADAAEFLARIRALLEQPLSLLL